MALVRGPEPVIEVVKRKQPHDSSDQLATSASKVAKGGAKRTLENLPQELHLNIASKLDRESFLTLASVSRPFGSILQSLRWSTVILDLSSSYRSRPSENTFVTRHVHESHDLHSPNPNFIFLGRFPTNAPKKRPKSGRSEKYQSVNDWILGSLRGSNVTEAGRYDGLFEQTRRLVISVPLYEKEYEGDVNFNPRRKVHMNSASKNVFWFLTKRVPAVFKQLNEISIELVANSKYDVPEYAMLFNQLVDKFRDRLKTEIYLKVNVDLTRKSRLHIQTPLDMQFVRELRIYYKVNESRHRYRRESSETTSPEQFAETIKQICGGQHLKLPPKVEKFSFVVAGLSGNNGGWLENNYMDDLPANTIPELLSGATKLRELMLRGFQVLTGDNNMSWLPTSVEKLTEDVQNVQLPAPAVENYTILDESYSMTTIARNFPNLKQLTLLYYKPGGQRRGTFRLAHSSLPPPSLHYLGVVRCEYWYDVIRAAAMQKVRHLQIFQQIERLPDGNRYRRPSDQRVQLLEVNCEPSCFKHVWRIREFFEFAHTVRIAINKSIYKELVESGVKLTEVGPYRLPCSIIDIATDAPRNRRAVNIVTGGGLGTKTVYELQYDNIQTCSNHHMGSYYYY